MKYSNLLPVAIFFTLILGIPASTHADNAVRITDGTSMDWSGTFSPNGETIAFVSNRSGLWAIWTLSVFSGGITQITSGEEFDHDPNFSPDGQRLAIFSHGDGSGNDIYTIGANGGTRVRLTDGGQNLHPDYSPDGSYIVFAHYDTDNYNLYVMSISGSIAWQLTDHPGNERYPDWSPDGTRITFTATWDGGPDIWIIPATGGEAWQLTNAGAHYGPVWSPDGTMIACDRTWHNNDDIWVYPVNGDDPIRVTDDPVFDWQPAWSPDGRQILFESIRISGRALWLINFKHPTSVMEPGQPAPRQLEARPNPANPGTVIAWTLPVAGQLDLSVYDLAGRLLRNLVDGSQPAGPGQVVWDGRSNDGQELPTGMYFARLVDSSTEERRVQSTKIMLVR